MLVVKRSRVVLTPGEPLPYKVVLEHGESGCTEHPVATIQEGEALIRNNTAPTEYAKVETLREWSVRES